MTYANDNRRPLRYGSVCSGIEAASAAWHPLGWTPEFFAEIERFPSEVLAHHYGSNLPGEEPSRNGVPNYGDMTKFKEWPDHGEGSEKSIDILVGGTPCQSFSVAGLRKGLADPRGNLALTYLALADRYRPRWVVWENVPGVLSSNGGRDFGAFLGGLAELGYGWAYRVLDAQYVRVDGYGRAVPQRRRRVFVVGYAGDWRRAGAVLFERESLSGHPAPRREAGKRAAPTVAGGARGRGGYSTDDIPLTETFPVGDLDGASKSWNATSTASGYLDPSVETYIASRDVAPTVRAGGNVTGGDRPYGMDVDTCDSLLVAFDTTQITSAANRSVPKAGDPCHPLAAGAHAPAIAYGLRNDAGRNGEAKTASADASGNVRLRDPGFNVYEGFAPTLDAGAPHAVAWSIMPQNSGRDFKARAVDVAQPLMAGGPVGGNQGGDYVQQGWAVRRLTPTECERLQGFPDGYTAIPRNGKPAADGPRYKALGNSMAVNVMRWIGRRIEMVEAMDAVANDNFPAAKEHAA